MSLPPRDIPGAALSGDSVSSSLSELTAGAITRAIFRAPAICASICARAHIALQRQADLVAPVGDPALRSSRVSPRRRQRGDIWPEYAKQATGSFARIAWLGGAQE